MPTVYEILERSCRITGLRTTGTEREIALAALQDAYRRAVLDSECNLSTGSYTFVADEDYYALDDMLGEQPMRLTHVTLTSNGNLYQLQQVSFQELLDVKQGNDVSSGSPYYYATIGFDRIAFYPNPTSGDSVSVWWVPDVPTLIESGTPAAGEELSPSKVPSAFHWSVLLPGVVLELLDKDQRVAESQTWMARYEKGIGRLQEHIGQMGGTANRFYVKKGS